MILLIDNYDSFSYNLVQLLGEILQEVGENEIIKVVRNDEITVEEVEKLTPSYLILSPGPGRPKEAGICERLILQMEGKTRILGVCLGHQAICEAYGGTITYAKQLMHGKQSEIKVNTKEALFENMESTIKVGRYHSLVAQQNSLPKQLEILASDSNGEIMAVKHRNYETYGVQFHPESVLTPLGKQMMKNFLRVS